MGAKVQFITPDKLIQPTIAPGTDGVISIDFHVDIFSDGKEDWLSTDDLNRLKFPISVEGGVDVATGTLGRTFILSEGWHLTPYGADHTYQLTGNVYTGDGSALMVFDSDYSVAVEYITTLTPPGLGLTPEQALALERTTFNDKVVVKTGGTTNTAYPAGTAAAPVGDVATATTIAVAEGIGTIEFSGFYALDSDDDLTNYKVIGAGGGAYLLMSSPVVTGADFYDCLIAGTMNGSDARFEHCVVPSAGLAGFDGTFDNVTFLGDITLATDAGTCYFINCHNGVAGSDHFFIDVNHGIGNVKASSHEGGIGITNMSNSDNLVVIDLVVGEAHLTSDVTAGRLIVRGVGELDNEASTDVYVECCHLLDDTLKMSVLGRQTLDSDGVLTIYKFDNVTELGKQTLTDKDGNAITLDAGTPANRTKNEL